MDYSRSARNFGGAVLAGMAALGLASCERIDTDRPESSRAFPEPHRPVSNLGSNQFSTEDARDSRGEAQEVMDLAGIEQGMTVADIGAGNGYYTVRLAERVGEKGRVLAQDIDRDALERLGRRVVRENFANVSIKPGAEDDPRLPEGSFDRIFLVHMYHEVAEPYPFLWRLRPALAKGGRVIVVETDRPTDRHGMPPGLLFCEFERVGFRLTQFTRKPEIAGYYAQFEATGTRPAPEDIESCSEADSESEAAGIEGKGRAKA